MAKQKIAQIDKATKMETKRVKAKVSPLSAKEMSFYIKPAKAQQEQIQGKIHLERHRENSKVDTDRIVKDLSMRADLTGLKIDLNHWLGNDDSYGGLKRLAGPDDGDFEGELRLTLWENHVAHPNDASGPKYSIHITVAGSGSGTANIDLILLHAHSKVSISATAQATLADQTICQRRILRMPASIRKEGYGYQGNDNPDMFKYTVLDVNSKQVSEESETINDCLCYNNSVPPEVATVSYEVPAGGGPATKVVKSSVELSAGADISLFSVGKKLDKFLFKFETEVKASVEIETTYILPAGHRYISSIIGAEDQFMISTPI